jgi:hypothetical protein
MRQEKPREHVPRDRELIAIAEIAQRRRLEAAFEKAKPILERETPTETSIQKLELPADVEAQVRAMPDSEQRIRAIVESKLSNRNKSSHRN